MLNAQYPIEPSLDSDGNLQALVPILGAASSKPVARPDIGKSWDVDIEARVEDTSVYAKLGVSTILCGESTLDHKTAVWDALVGKNAVEDSPTDKTVIFQTFWGIGLRVAITFRSSEITGSANIASIAASAEYRRVEVQYEIKSIGLGPSELADVLSVLPPLGKFDMNAYNTLDSVRGDLVDSLKKRLDQSANATTILQPAIISLAGVPFTDELGEATEYRFAMQSIAAGLAIEQALARLDGNTWKGVQPGRVQAIYRDVLGDATRPDGKAKKLARKWLSITE